MRDPMALFGVFLLGLLLSAAWHRHQLRQVKEERDNYRRAFLALAETIEREDAIFRSRFQK